MGAADGLEVVRDLYSCFVFFVVVVVLKQFPKKDMTEGRDVCVAAY